MGIRFDSSSRRATNGPLIFFSDPSSQLSFSEELRGAINSNLCFYSYRLPGDSMISFGSSEGYVEGVGIPGFVIGRFNPVLPFITIPYKGCKPFTAEGISYSMPTSSTPRHEYIKEVEEFIALLHGKPEEKIVAARVEVRNESLDLATLFFDFCKKFPKGYIFCFSTPTTGCWIGASPELLLASHQGVLSTMSLAGTRSISADTPWDEKNIMEQSIVTRYILQCFISNGLSPVTGKTYTRQSGGIEHICTPIEADFNSEASFHPSLLSTILKELSPTPALCGYPKTKALEAIKRFENFDRGCYGGFCGPYHSLRDFTFNVVLRCASVSDRQYCIYAGGGITEKSVPESEWLETEAKISNTFPIQSHF